VAILSGQDYSIRPVADLRVFLNRHEGKSFLSSMPLPEPLLGPDGGLKRIQQPHLPIRRRRFRLPFMRPLPFGIRPYAASQFVVMRTDFGVALMSEIERRPELAAYCRRSWIPDELSLPLLR
jgi:hypothetical protein